MRMGISIVSLLLLSLLMPGDRTGDGKDVAFAAAEETRKMPRQPLLHADRVARQTPIEQGKGGQKKSTKKTTKTASRAGVDPSHTDLSSDRLPGPAGQKKRGKSGRALAAVHPKRDLSYHGMVQRPERYDPRPEHHTCARNPRISDLQQDHFQELDKNQDGLLDPFERARGRLDLDRDLSNLPRD